MTGKLKQLIYREMKKDLNTKLRYIMEDKRTNLTSVSEEWITGYRAGLAAARDTIEEWIGD